MSTSSNPVAEPVRRDGIMFADMHKTITVLMLIVAFVLFCASVVTANTMGIGVGASVLIVSAVMLGFEAVIKDAVKTSVVVGNAYGAFVILCFVAMFVVASAVVPPGGVPVGGVPVGDVPVGDVPVGDVPVGGVPVGGVPVGGVPVGG
jgi:hypothetical protein